MKKIAIVIPGNPPISYFYKKWERELINLGIFSEVQTLTYPIKDVDSCEIEYFDEVRSYFKQQIISVSKDAQLTLIGHSIGGFFALSLMDEIDLEVDRCSVIFPFLGDASSYGKFVLNTAKKLEGRQNIINIAAPFFKRSISVLSKNFYAEASSAIALAWKEKSYFADQQGELEFEFPHLNLSLFDLKTLSKINLIYNKHDDWCSKKTVSYLKTYIDSHFVDASHAFITNERERNRVAGLLTQIHLN